jgi:uncharacterized protein (TIGR00255 family)
LRIELRTVNHRFFNFAPKLPSELAPLEAELRERLRREFERGHVALSARWVDAPPLEAELRVDLPRAAVVASELRALRDAVGLAGEVTLELVARQPDVLSWRAPESREVGLAEVEAVLAQAASECRGMRAREGAVLAGDLGARLAQLDRHAAEVESLAPARLLRERDRLRASVGQLLEGRSADESRIAQEVALLADRLDVTEELVRLRSHVAAARGALAQEGAVGRQLGFLVQELGREVNTIGSKANDAAIQQLAVAMKGELEKVREQLENVE